MKKLSFLFIAVLTVVAFTNCKGTVPGTMTYSVTYNGNGSDGGAVPADDNLYEKGAEVTVMKAGTLTLTHYTFSVWNTAADGGGTDYAANEKFKMGGSDVTLYAQWNINKYTLSYNGNGNTGGTVPESSSHDYNSMVTVASNSGALLKINAAGASYRFAGWNTQSDGNGANFEAGTGTFTMGSGNVILYAKWIAYTLRDTGPAGGLIFYDKGSYSSGWRYLEAAPVGQGWASWGTNPYDVQGADGTAIGTGKQNTVDITDSDSEPDKAADRCTDYSIIAGGVTYDDWFLPSKDELNAMYVNLKQQGVGGLSNSYYWSSSENSNFLAWIQNFSDGGATTLNKTLSYPVRSVRAF